jgi:hypothetical protein
VRKRSWYSASALERGCPLPRWVGQHEIELIRRRPYRPASLTARVRRPVWVLNHLSVSEPASGRWYRGTPTRPGAISGLDSVSTRTMIHSGAHQRTQFPDQLNDLGSNRSRQAHLAQPISNARQLRLEPRWFGERWRGGRYVYPARQKRHPRPQPRAISMRPVFANSVLRVRMTLWVGTASRLRSLCRATGLEASVESPGLASAEAPPRPGT